MPSRLLLCCRGTGLATPAADAYLISKLGRPAASEPFWPSPHEPATLPSKLLLCCRGTGLATPAAYASDMPGCLKSVGLLKLATGRMACICEEPSSRIDGPDDNWRGAGAPAP